MPIDAGLTTPPIAVDGFSSAPISTPETTSPTSSASSTGLSAPTRKVSGRSRPATASQITSTIVCTAIPPIRFPAASSRFPCAAADTVIATSGRLPATERSSSPPSSSPSPNRTSSASVAFDSVIPAPQVAAAATANSTSKQRRRKARHEAPLLRARRLLECLRVNGCRCRTRSEAATSGRRPTVTFFPACARASRRRSTPSPCSGPARKATRAMPPLFVTARATTVPARRTTTCTPCAGASQR